MAKDSKEKNVILKNVTIFKQNGFCEYKDRFARKILYITEWWGYKGISGDNLGQCPCLSRFTWSSVQYTSLSTHLTHASWPYLRGCYGRQCQKPFRSQGRWHLLLSPGICLPQISELPRLYLQLVQRRKEFEDFACFLIHCLKLIRLVLPTSTMRRRYTTNRYISKLCEFSVNLMRWTPNQTSPPKSSRLIVALCIKYSSVINSSL